MSTLEERASAIRARVEAACARAGRHPDEVRIVAVSKHHPPESIRALAGLGFVDFGENYVQELVSKAELLRDLGVRWHLIGHLQSNKIGQVLPHISGLQTLDSLRLLDRVRRRAAVLGRSLDVHIEVNLGDEAQKHGVVEKDLDALVSACSAAPEVQLLGLMAIPPAVETPDAARPYFKRLRALAAARGLSSLSMGMSGDFEIAIEEGASLVRIGTALFGARA